MDTRRALGAELVTGPAAPYSSPCHVVHQSRRLEEEIEGAIWANQFDNLSNRRAHIGGNGRAGGWGHNPLAWMDEDGLKYRAEVPCYCGKQGCIETFISGTGFATDYHRLSGQPLKGNEIMRLVEEQDPVAELALSRYEMRLAKSLAHVVNILDPDVIVLGGGMSNVDRLYATVPNLVKQWVFVGECETPIRKAVHGDSSGVRGAAWLLPE